jgi:hydrogenase nickel incorporation protein HypA/HybF
MHEVSIAQSIVSVVENSISERHSKKVTNVFLIIGKLSGIEVEALQAAFSFVKEKTILEHSGLTIEIVKGAAICNECNTEFELDEYASPCPTCGSFSLKLIKGQEMKVTHIELED